MLGIIVIAAIAAIVIWYWLVRPLSLWTRLGVKQTKPWIFLGDSHMTLIKKLSFNEYVYTLYNIHPETRYSGFYNFGRPVLILRDPELIKKVMVKDFDHFIDHTPFIDPDADPLWSNALLSLQEKVVCAPRGENHILGLGHLLASAAPRPPVFILVREYGERWKAMRNTLSPTFTSSKMKSIYSLMLKPAENFVKHFLEKSDDIIEIEVKETYSRFSNDIIATTAFGVEVNSLKDNNNIFYTMGKKLTNFGGGFILALKFLGHQTFPFLMKTLGIPFLDGDAAKYFCEVLDETIKARDANNIVRNDMLNLMLETRNENKVPHHGLEKSKELIKLSDADITSQAMIFFFGGFDTISTAMSFGSYELALNQDIQERLRKEIKKTQKDGKVSYDELMEMKYMDMVVSEILRKWPPFPTADRLCTKPYVIEPVNADEKPIPISVNQSLWLPIYGLHRDPKYFPNPEKFDPERFSDENKHNIVPYSYIPFGGGPRVCIGNRFALLEIKALLFNLLLHYEIVPTKKTQIPLVLSKDFSQIPVGGLWLGLKPIQT